jgi:hypothetical protein
MDEEIILIKAGEIHPSLKEYLREQRSPDIWRRLKKNSRSSSALLKHFLLWFDGLKTLKFINHLTRNGMPSIDMFSALRQLLKMTGKGLPMAVEQGKIPSLDVRLRILDYLRNR